MEISAPKSSTTDPDSTERVFGGKSIFEMSSETIASAAWTAATAATNRESRTASAIRRFSTGLPQSPISYTLSSPTVILRETRQPASCFTIVEPVQIAVRPRQVVGSGATASAASTSAAPPPVKLAPKPSSGLDLLAEAAHLRSSESRRNEREKQKKEAEVVMRPCQIEPGAPLHAPAAAYLAPAGPDWTGIIRKQKMKRTVYKVRASPTAVAVVPMKAESASAEAKVQAALSS